MSAPLVKGWAQVEVSNFLRLKYIAPSTGAALGYKDLNVKIVAPGVSIKASLFLATLLLFVDIDLALEAVQQSA